MTTAISNIIYHKASLAMMTSGAMVDQFCTTMQQATAAEHEVKSTLDKFASIEKAM